MLAYFYASKVIDFAVASPQTPFSKRCSYSAATFAENVFFCLRERNVPCQRPSVDYLRLELQPGNAYFSIHVHTSIHPIRGTAVYTSSWVAPKADVHSQQRFFYMGQKGEINVDQAHRGYTVSKDGDGFKSVNPLFMKYTPTDGNARTRATKRRPRLRFLCM